MIFGRKGLRMCAECQFYGEGCCLLSGVKIPRTYEACERFVEIGAEIEQKPEDK